MPCCCIGAWMDPMCSDAQDRCDCVSDPDFERSAKMFETPEPKPGLYSTPDQAKTRS